MSGWVEVPFPVQKPHHGWRVDRYLSQRLRRYSRSAVQKLIDAGQVSVKGRTLKASSAVKDGDVIVIRYPRREEAAPPVERLVVLFEDEYLLAVDKPAGVLSHPTDKVLRNAATTILKEQFPALRLHLAHRLDRETSGVLLFAKSPEIARALYRQFVAREIHKEYLAVVAGEVAWRTKRVDAALGNDGGVIKVKQKAGAGQPAVTEFALVKAGEKASLVRARPQTGRLHQIRVHLALLGHPIVGDKLYIGNGEAYLKAVDKTLTRADLDALGADRQLLHAHRMTLLHPVTGAALTLSAPLPSEFERALTAPPSRA